MHEFVWLCHVQTFFLVLLIFAVFSNPIFYFTIFHHISCGQPPRLWGEISYGRCICNCWSGIWSMLRPGRDADSKPIMCQRYTRDRLKRKTSRFGICIHLNLKPVYIRFLILYICVICVTSIRFFPHWFNGWLWLWWKESWSSSTGKTPRRSALPGVLDGGRRWARTCLTGCFSLAIRGARKSTENARICLSVSYHQNTTKHHTIPGRTISYTSFVPSLDTYDYSQEWIRWYRINGFYYILDIKIFLYYTYIYIYCTFTFAKSHMHPKSLLSRQTKTLPLQLATYVGRIDWWIANSSTVNILLFRKEYPERQTCKVIFLMKPGIAIARLFWYMLTSPVWSSGTYRPPPFRIRTSMTMTIGHHQQNSGLSWRTRRCASGCLSFAMRAKMKQVFCYGTQALHAARLLQRYYFQSTNIRDLSMMYLGACFVPRSSLPFPGFLRLGQDLQQCRVKARRPSGKWM